MVEDREFSINPEEGIDEFISERPAGRDKFVSEHTTGPEIFYSQNPITALAIPDERITRDPITVAIDDQTQYDLIVGELHQINTSRQEFADAAIVDAQTPDLLSVKKGPSLENIATAGFIALGAVVELERAYSRFKQSRWKKR